MSVFKCLKILSPALFSFCLFSCADTSDIRTSELRVFDKRNVSEVNSGEKAPTSFDEYVDYTNRLASMYLAKSSIAAGNQDAVALGLIGAAGVASGGLLYGGPLAMIKGAGLGAGLLTAGATYFKPGEMSTHLIDAASQLNCMTGVAPPVETDKPQGMEILRSGILKVQISLHKKMLHILPTYDELLTQMKAAATAKMTKDAGLQPQTIENYRAEISLCAASSQG